jgi:hypothetical protein
MNLMMRVAIYCNFIVKAIVVSLINIILFHCYEVFHHIYTIYDGYLLYNAQVYLYA